MSSEAMVSHNKCECTYDSFRYSDCLEFHLWSYIDSFDTGDYELFEKGIEFYSKSLLNEWLGLEGLPLSWKINAIETPNSRLNKEN